MIHAWWLPPKDVDPLVKKQAKIMSTSSAMQKRAIELFKETQVEWGGIGVVCSDNKIHLLNQKKDNK